MQRLLQPGQPEHRFLPRPPRYIRLALNLLRWAIFIAAFSILVSLLILVTTFLTTGSVSQILANLQHSPVSQFILQQPLIAIPVFMIVLLCAYASFQVPPKRSYDVEALHLEEFVPVSPDDLSRQLQLKLIKRWIDDDPKLKKELMPTFASDPELRSLEILDLEERLVDIERKLVQETGKRKPARDENWKDWVSAVNNVASIIVAIPRAVAKSHFCVKRLRRIHVS